MKHYLGICLVLLTLAAIAFLTLRTCTSAVDHTIDSVRDAFVEVLRVQPKVTVNQQVVMTQTSPIAELAVVSKEELVTLHFTTHLEVLSLQLPLTEKTFSAEAAYKIKAGFDLREPFTVEINPQTHALQATMPHATILSVEQVGDLSYKGDDAWLNRVTDEERQKVVNQLNASAHEEAEKSTLKAEAEQQVADRLNELLHHNGQPLTIEWKGTVHAPLQVP